MADGANQKIIRNPFFPLLFIAEFVKTATTFGVTTQPDELPIVLVMGVLAVGSTVIWILRNTCLMKQKRRIMKQQICSLR